MDSFKAAQNLVEKLQTQGWKVRCVESCTAGALTAVIGQVAGVSSVLDRSWITYSNQAKHEEVGVSLALLAQYGSVSEEVVMAMAEGAVQGCERDTLAIAVSGIAGPSGCCVDKPVGTVWIAVKRPCQGAVAHLSYLTGSRVEIQQQAVVQALGFALASC